MSNNKLVKWGAVALGAYMLLKFLQTVNGIGASGRFGTAGAPAPPAAFSPNQ